MITVLEARPMNEVGFRSHSGNNPGAKRPKPEITVVDARPMSQSEFLDCVVSKHNAQ